MVKSPIRLGAVLFSVRCKLLPHPPQRSALFWLEICVPMYTRVHVQSWVFSFWSPLPSLVCAEHTNMHNHQCPSYALALVLMALALAWLCPTPTSKSNQHQVQLDPEAQSMSSAVASALLFMFASLSVSLLLRVAFAAPQWRESFSFTIVLLQVLAWICWAWVTCPSLIQLQKQRG